jgi:hypothetical protein
VRLARRQAVIGVTFAGIAVLFLALGAGLAALFPAAFAALLVWSGIVGARSGRAVMLNNTAYEHLTRGKVDEAERLLAQIHPAAARKGAVARSMATQRAMIALHRGDAEGAISEATRGLDAPRGLFGHYYQATQDANALGLRAIAHASLGHDEHARAVAALDDDEARARRGSRPSSPRAARRA